jgi:Bifunctional DNA primase/polymerase, N-terminal
LTMTIDWIAAEPEVRASSNRAMAMTLLGLGFATLPVAPGHKVPSTGRSGPMSWKTYQQRMPSSYEVDAWWPADDANRHGVGVVTGELSGLTVFDADGPKAIRALLRIADRWPTAPVVFSGSGRSVHVWFAHRGERSASAIATFDDGSQVDVRGRSGFIVVPYTRHPDTAEPYTWARPLTMEPLPVAPVGLRVLSQPRPKRTVTHRTYAPNSDPTLVFAIARYGDLRTFCERTWGMVFSGDRARCRLPGHDDRSPSFDLQPESGAGGRDLFWCGGCSRGGDLFGALAIAWGCDRTDVLGRLWKEMHR